MSALPVPREFQTEMVASTRKATLLCSSVLVQAPTGAGKTFVAAMMAAGAAAKGKRVIITVHRDFLVEQTASMLDLFGLQYGIIASGYTGNPRALIQIAAIDTLKNRLEKVNVPALVLVDEAHHSVAAGWAKVIAFFVGKGSKIVGLTATPIRLDGRGLGEFYSELVMGPTVRWLIDNGYLSEYQAYAPSIPDLSGVHTRMGDYIKAEAEEAVDRPTITGDAIREYTRLAHGKRAVVFCISVKHSQHVCASFNESGIPAAHIDGTTPRDERKRLLAKFRRGEILVLTSVEIFGEGFDLPTVEVAILLRPTQSLSLHLQQIGRALRVAEGKAFAIILDHVGNLMRLGLPDSDFDWSLDGRKKRKGKASGDVVNVKQCENCYAVFWPPPACPSCGHIHVTAGNREVEQVDGELQKLTPEMLAAMRAQKKREVMKAKTIEDLEAIERARNYKPGWAKNTFEARKGAAASWRAEAQAKAYGR